MVVANVMCAVTVHITQDPYVTDVNLKWDGQKTYYNKFQAKPGPHTMEWKVTWFTPSDNKFHSFSSNASVALSDNMESITFNFIENRMETSVKYKN